MTRKKYISEHGLKVGDRVKFFNYNETRFEDADTCREVNDNPDRIAIVKHIAADCWIVVEWEYGARNKEINLFHNLTYDECGYLCKVENGEYPIPVDKNNDDILLKGTALQKMPRKKKLTKHHQFYTGQKIKLSDYTHYHNHEIHIDEIATVIGVDDSDGKNDIDIRWENGDKSLIFNHNLYSGAYEVDEDGNPIGTKKKQPTSLPAPADAGNITQNFMELIANVDQAVSQRIHDTVGHQLDELSQRAEKALQDIDKTKKLEIVVDGNGVILEGVQHKEFVKLLKIAQLRQNALLVGMAGTGKTHAGSQVAEALQLPFYTMSVGAQTSKSDIIGYMSATGEYVKTHFREAYENGGVFLMDEIDAGNANVLIQVNAALSNGVMSFPDEMIKRHKDFIFIASANTFGTGMNRQYVGRNQLDAATLDRFTIVEWDIDNDLEELLANKQGKWLMAVRGAREFLNQHNIRALITPRATQKGSALLDNGFKIEEVITAVMLGSVPEDRKKDVLEHAKRIYQS